LRKTNVFLFFIAKHVYGSEASQNVGSRIVTPEGEKP
jgi:hypothetical protein